MRTRAFVFNTILILLTMKISNTQQPSQLSYHEIRDLLESKTDQIIKIKKAIKGYCRKLFDNPRERRLQDLDQTVTRENSLTYALQFNYEESNTDTTRTSTNDSEYDSEEGCVTSLTDFDWNACNNIGLTYEKYSHQHLTNIDHVGCDECSENSGNTICYQDNQLLCHYHGSYNRPDYPITNPNTNNGWSEGMIKATHNYMGCLITNQIVGDIVCADQFGPNWKMAESKQGKIIPGMMNNDYIGQAWHNNGPKEFVSWKFWANGDIDASEGQRFWVHHENGFNCFSNIN